MRTTIMTTAALLGLALLTPAQSASAAAVTCGGLPATIIGEPGGRVVGTEGPDVIVTDGALSVDALGGDDRICVSFETGFPYGAVEVLAGAGNDLVDGTASTNRVLATLGSGTDTFVGGGSDDLVVVEYPDPGAPDVVQGGGGADLLQVRTAAGPGEVDNVSGRLVLSGEVRTTWTGMERFQVSPAEGTSPWRMVGTDAAEELGWFPRGDGATIDADLGGGADAFFSEVPPASTSRLDGGTGRDSVYIASTRAALDLDLAAGTLTVGRRSSAHEIETSAFEDADLFARRVTVRGTSGPNDIGLTACDGTVRTGAGDDTVERQYDALFESDIRCTESLTVNGGAGDDDLSGTRDDDVLKGGPGKDRLEGGFGQDRLLGGGGRDVLVGMGDADVLLGGPGRDRADGGKGRDRCVAERRQGCERR